MHKKAHSFSVKNENGFTLVEIMVSLIILLILVVAFVPLFTFVSQAIASNKAKDIAIELSTQKMEELRSLPYVVLNANQQIDTTKPQLGNVGGTPPGSVAPTQTINVNGKNYVIATSITWGDESHSFKIVSVTVTAPGVFNEAVNITNRFDTMAAQEGIQVQPGSILVKIYDSEGELQDNTIDVTVSTDGYNETDSTNNGEVLFDNLPSGTYSVSALVPNNMTYHPDLQPKYNSTTHMLVENNITVTYNKQAKVEFIIDSPGNISLSINDRLLNSAISNTNVTGGTLVLGWFESDPASAQNKTISFSQADISGGQLSPTQIGNLWPGGTYTLKLTVNKNLTSTDLKPYGAYDMAIDSIKPTSSGTNWDGTLSAGSTKHLTVSLEPLLKAHLISNTGITKRGTTSYIAQWADQSGYGNHATNSSNDSTQPTLSGSTVVFDMGNSQTLTMPNAVKCSNDFTVFAVAKATRTSSNLESAKHEIDASSNSSTTGTAGQKYLFYPNYEGANAGMGISLGSNGISNYEHGSGYMPATVVYGTSTLGIAGEILRDGLNWVFNTIAVRYRNSERQKPVMYLNGTQTDGTYMKTRYPSARSTVYSPTIIGGGSYGYFNGEVKEILIYKSALSDTNLQQVNAYLNNKY